LDERLDEEADRVSGGPDDLDRSLVAGRPKVDVVHLQNSVACLQLPSFTGGTVRKHILDEDARDGRTTLWTCIVQVDLEQDK